MRRNSWNTAAPTSALSSSSTILVPNLTALENVELAAQICSDSLDAEQTLCQVGLGERLANFPAQLSGGEQRACPLPVHWPRTPSCFYATSPRARLTTRPASRSFGCYRTPVANGGITVIIITHNSHSRPWPSPDSL